MEMIKQLHRPRNSELLILSFWSTIADHTRVCRSFSCLRLGSKSSSNFKHGEHVKFSMKTLFWVSRCRLSGLHEIMFEADRFNVFLEPF